MKLLYVYNRILTLLEERGEIVDCKIMDCSTCKEIENHRSFLAGREYRKSPKGKYNRVKRKYTVMNEEGKSKVFYSLRKVLSYMSIGQKMVNEIMNTGKSRNGFTVDCEEFRGD